MSKLQRRPKPSPMFPTPERQSKGGFIEGRTYERDDDGQRRPVRVMRSADATAVGRLRNVTGLTPAQLLAAAYFEQDHEIGRVETRTTANLDGSGGMAAGEMPVRVLEARDRKHHALNALRAGGQKVVAVTEAVVLTGVTVPSMGAQHHKDRRAGTAWATLALDVGLNLLEAHYRMKGRIA